MRLAPDPGSKYSRLVLVVGVVLSLLGVVAWLTMPRQEDPNFPDRFATFTIYYPGADAETLERLVVSRLENELLGLDEIDYIDSTSRVGIAVLFMALRDDVDVDEVTATWDEVERTAREAAREFPDGASEPEMDRRLPNHTVVLAITGSSDPLELADAAERVGEALQQVEGVARYDLVGKPGKQITIEYDPVVARRLDLDIRSLVGQLQSRNLVPVAGVIRVGSKTASVRPSSEFESVEEIERTPIVLPTGKALPLREIAKVRYGPREPALERMRFNGQIAVGVGLEPSSNIDLVKLGSAVRAKVDTLRDDVAPLEIHEFSFQPDNVEQRLYDLGMSLAQSVIVVALVLVLTMGVRVGLLVSALVPLVSATSIAIYAMGGGILHQMSCASLIMALGMLVDNAIVVAENIQSRLDRGESVKWAAGAAVRELAMPLCISTGTTHAAFIPMLLAEGSSAEFTIAIPIVVILTLTVSAIFALTATPMLAMYVLKRGTAYAENSWLERWAERIGAFGTYHYKSVLICATLAVLASFASAGLIAEQFFPPSDRNTVVVDLELADGSHIDEIDEIARQVEAEVLQREGVRKVTTFVGRSAPPFYYNLSQRPQSPQLAQIIVETADPEATRAIADWTRRHVRSEHPGVAVVAKGLGQGPPIRAPLEVRLSGDDFGELRTAADRVAAVLKEVPGALDVRDDQSMGSPTIHLSIDDVEASERSLSRADVVEALLAQTRGVPVGEYRAEEDPISIVVRAPEGDQTTLQQIRNLSVDRGPQQTPLEQLAHTEVELRPSAIHHRDGVRKVSVLAEPQPGVATGVVFRELKKRLEGIELPEGVELTYGGEAEASARANRSMFATLPIGMLLLVACLLLEFNSLRLVTIILVTVPLAAVGIIPGLIVGDQPFSFMSLLAVFGLVGIVVNNAIVLLDLVERRRKGGADIPTALVAAVRERTRPIMLTTLTTIVGLLPLALGPSPMWPPFAWGMISGLGASALFTLLVVPALYRVMIRERAGESVTGYTVLAAIRTGDTVVARARLVSPPSEPIAAAPRTMVFDRTQLPVQPQPELPPGWRRVGPRPTRPQRALPPEPDAATARPTRRTAPRLDR